MMADEERRTGDWQNRSHEEANTIIGAPNPKKWYQQTFWIIGFLLVFWPVGIVLCWKSDWHVAFKILATILVAVAVFFAWNMSQAVQQMQAVR